jgi:N-acetyl-gamma-glutamyl-phosphate reductase
VGFRTAVVGASGYAGGELLRLLDAHPSFEIATLVAGGGAGRLVGDVHPHLVTLADRRLIDVDTADLADADVIFLALPHGASAPIAASLATDTVIVDLGADFRLRDSGAWARWYAGDHAGHWPYGLPELPGGRSVVAASRRVANPGCYATAIQLGIAPLLTAGLVTPHDIVVVATSGTTGGGRTPSVPLLASEVIGDVAAYKVAGAHQHLGEVQQSLGDLVAAPVTLSFTPVLAPMARGILATCTARLTAPLDDVQLRSAYAGYDDEPFVTLLAAGRQPHPAATIGSNSAHLQVARDADAERAVVTVALDNLGKGAAGQAIQNANLMLGLDETAGLAVNGIGA